MWSLYQKFIINMGDGHTHLTPVLRVVLVDTALVSPRTWRQTHPAFEDILKNFFISFRHGLCSISSTEDNIYKYLPGFIIHFHHRNLRIFPLRRSQQRLVVLMPE